MTEGRRYAVCTLDNLPVGALTPVDVGRAKAVLWRGADGQVHAFPRRCPHQGADLSFGCVSDLTEAERANEITVDPHTKVLRCPWHGFGYALSDGREVAGEALRLRMLKVEIDGDDVVVVV